MEKPENQILVIFGASGDLTKRKLLPSLFGLHMRGLLPDKFRILGAARTEMSAEEYRKLRRDDIVRYDKPSEEDAKRLDSFMELVDYIHFNTDDSKQYKTLADKIKQLQDECGIADNVLFYLSMPPGIFDYVTESLKESGLNKSKNGFRRIVIEKPFGTDLESAKKLSRELGSIFRENEIYRIDHYLGKETVQNILVLRFANGIFEPLWNRNYIDSIEICAYETLGIENRGAYYESSGALRDMVQNHLMHLMAFIAMECPPNFDAESLRNEIVKVFKSLKPLSSDEIKKHVFRGQYGEGVVNGQKVAAYVGEKNVAPDSHTETFVAMKFFIDNWRWNGVPFYFYTGKRMAEKKSEVTINFKTPPQRLFPGMCDGPSCNKLTLRIQPDESIALKFGMKTPGAGFDVTQVAMDFKYSSLSEVRLPDAYERLLLDAMSGDSTLYARSDALEASWKFVTPIMERWKKDGKKGLQIYAAGSQGTKEAVDMMMEHSAAFCPLPVRTLRYMPEKKEGEK